MKVILLCAGYATRLYPLTKDRPKALLPIQDRAILDWILDYLKPVQDIDGIYVVTNHRFAEAFGDWASAASYPWPIRVVDDGTTTNENRLGAVGDLQFTLTSQGIQNEDLLVVAGDNLFDFDVKSFVTFGKTKRPYPAIAMYDVENRELAKQYGLVLCGPDSQVSQFLEKPQDPPTTMASCGLYWLPKETCVLLDKYLSGGHNPDQPGHYMRWLAETHRLYAVSLKGCWFDIGDLQSYQKANEVYQKNKLERKPS
ncbi:MAG: nucleotidyltransferase family protein [Candidatus Omnitrophica bacterium]|nr:nucleotidyltransferase family protein [Candidatus Omnitrophota bacterium]